MYSKTVQKLIDQFSKFPTIGPRTAARFVFYLQKLSKKETKGLIESIINFKKSIKSCSFCFNTFEGKKGLCQICKDPSRDKNLLCLVEKETDMISLEKTKQYKGLYFILSGIVSVSKNGRIKKLQIQELVSRIKNPQKLGILDAKFNEIILALNPTTKGDIAALRIQKILKPLDIKITRLGRGLPLGGELEYADEETLKSALEGRK
jgi:recombination protein RecR